MTKTTHPKYRKAAFLDLNTMEPVLTVEIQPTLQDKGRWLNIHSNGTPLMFASETERDAWLKAKRKHARRLLESSCDSNGGRPMGASCLESSPVVRG